MMNYLALLCRNSNIFLPGTTAHKPNEPRYISYARIGPRALRVGEPGGNTRYAPSLRGGAWARTAIDGAET